jgi:hypothetical protein
MSSEKLNLAIEFEKIQIDPLRKRNEVVYEVLRHQAKSAPEHNLKVKDKIKRYLVRPSRLKLIGNSYKSKMKSCIALKETDKDKEVDTYASEAFSSMRITSKEETSSQSNSTNMQDDKDDKTPTQPSQSCSAQAKLQQQLSSSELDSTIEEMSDYFSFHLSLYKDKNYLVDSMYT